MVQRFKLRLKIFALLIIASVTTLYSQGEGIELWQLRNANGSGYFAHTLPNGLWDTININRLKALYGLGSGGGGITSISTTSPLTGGPITTTGTIGITESSTNTSGFLSSANFTAFNNKLNGSGIGGRLGIFNGTNNLITDALAWDYSTNKLGIGYTDTTSLSNDITGGSGLGISGLSTGISLKAANSWHQIITDDTKFELWSNASGGNDRFKINYSNGQPNFRYLNSGVASAVNDRVVINTSSGDLKSLTAGTNGHVLKQTATGPQWQAESTGATYTEGNGINILSNVISVETSGNGISAGASGVALNAFMQDIASNTNTGIMVRASSGAAGTSAYRTLTQGTGISISNGNGVAGNPTINNTAPFSPTTSGTTNQILTKTPVGYDWVTPSGGTGTVTSITAGSGISTSAAGLNAQITTSGTLYNVAARVAELSRNGVYSITATAATDNIIDFVTPQVDYANSMTVDPTNDYISVPSGGSQNSTFFYTVTIKPSVTTDISMWVRQGTSTTLMRTLTKQTCPTNQTCTISFSSRGIFNTPATQQYKLILQSSSSANIEVLQGYFTMSGNY